MGRLIADKYKEWEAKCEERFNKLKSNEEELNRIFNEIYGLQKELTPDVAAKDVTVRRADLQREIKSLISYAVGCLFGRYSVNKEGLMFAGGEWDEWFDANKEILVANGYKVVTDNIIPVYDDEYS
ncbi:MAG: hypothetical protein IJS94_01590, partial [Clostridia bacterium]|nr:hypothetical protein [Clostridia bacterium]